MAQFFVTVDHTKVSADLTDFPIFINLADAPASFWSVVQNGGGDIRVYKADGVTELPRDVVSCDTGTDTGELHVKYSGTLSASVNTVLIIDVDGIRSDYAATATYGRNNVWNDYKIVAHLNEASGTRTDSAGNDDLADNNTVPNATGKVGANGANFTRANNERLTTTTADIITGDQPVEMEVWHKTSLASTYRVISSLVISSGGTRWFFENQINNSDNRNYAEFGFVNGSAQGVAVSYTTALNDGNWHHIVAKIRNNAGVAQIRLYTDGVLRATSSHGSLSYSLPAALTSFTLGATRNWSDGAYTHHVTGDIDEGRLRLGSATSDEYTTTIFNNQNSPSTFYSITETTFNVSVNDTVTISESVGRQLGDIKFIYQDDYEVVATTNVFTFTNFACPVTVNGILMVFTTYNNGVDATSVTFNGQNLTKATGYTGAAFFSDGDMWYLVNPPNVTANIVVTLSASVAGRKEINALVYSNVNQTTPINAFNSSYASSGTSASISVTTTVDNCILVGGWKSDSYDFIEGAGTIFRGGTFGSMQAGDSGGSVGVAGSKTLNASLPLSGDKGIVAVALAPVDPAFTVSVSDTFYVNEWVQRRPVVNIVPTSQTARTTKQVIYGGLPTSAPSVSAVSWATIHSQNSSETWAATQAWRRTIFSGAVRPIRIFYTLSAPPGVGKSYEFALVRDVSTVISTVTISDLNTTGFTNFSFSTIPAETTLSIRCTPTGTPDSTFVMWGFAYETTEDNIFIINGSTGSGPTATDGAVSYNHIMGGGTWSTTTSALRENISSLPFIIRKFSVLTTAPGTGNSRTMAVVLNGVQQTATNLVFGATDALLTVSGLDILVLPGDTLSIVNIASGTPTTSGLNTWSISAENFYLGESWVAGSTTDATGSSPSFIRIKNSSASTESATASDVHRLSVGPAHTLKDFIVWDKTSTRQTAPGFLTNEIYIGLAKNGTLDTNTTATLGKSNVTQRLNSSSTIAEGDNLSVTFDSFIGSPLSPTVAHAFTQYIQPTFFTPVSITEAVTVVQIIPAEEVSVFDSIGITESVTLTTTATWSVSVSDTVSITETTAQQRNAFVSAVDTLTITENINLNRVSNLSVSDSVTVTESVTATFVGAGFSASVFDAITLTENTTNLRSINIAPFDAFTITENVTRLQTLFTTAAENVSVLESTTQHVVNFVNTFDLVSITESATSAIVLVRSVSDTLTISESVTLERPVTSIQLPQDRYKGTAKRINMKVGGSI